MSMRTPFPMPQGIDGGNHSEAAYVVYQLNSTTYGVKNIDPALPVPGTNSDIGALLNTLIANMATAYGNQNGGKIVIRGYGGLKPYLCSTRVTPNKGVIIQGSGDNVTSTNRGNTVIKQADNSNLAVFFDGADSIAYRDIMFLGNSANNSGANTQCVATASSDNIQIENCIIYDFKGIGLYINGGRVGYYKRVFVELSQQKNFYLDATSNATVGNTFEGCISFGATSVATVGFYLHNGALYNRFIGCESLDDASLSGWWLDALSNYNTFDGCVARNTTGTTSKDGFHLQGAQYNTFNGCVVRNMGQQTNNTYYGFNIEDDGSSNHSTNNVFSGCIIKSDAANKLKYGFFEKDTNQDKNIYLGCQISGPATATMQILGPSSIIGDVPGTTPFNKISNFLNTTTNNISPYNGNTATVGASADYLISNRGMFITAADSSNANNAILIKDGAGNTVIGPVHTLTAQYVPAGYKINWGAFTGSAGAVTVWFV